VSWRIAKHVFAVLAALITGVASVLQARKALEKAKHELQHSVSTQADATTDKALLLAAENANYDAQHFRHVAKLWAIILLAAILTFVPK
jgi:hypothetical protein